jgi:hypothetical protein
MPQQEVGLLLTCPTASSHRACPCCLSAQVIKNKIRGVNMKGFGYGGEDAYFYASGQ